MTKIKMTKICHMCRLPVSLTLDNSDYSRWQAGDLAQNCFPYLSADEREILISGICGPCFDGMFDNAEDAEGTEDVEGEENEELTEPTEETDETPLPPE